MPSSIPMMGRIAAVGPCTGCTSCDEKVASLRTPRTLCATIVSTVATAARIQNASPTATGRPIAAPASLQSSARPVRPSGIANVLRGKRAAGELVMQED
jgi:hypothetical protein